MKQITNIPPENAKKMVKSAAVRTSWIAAIVNAAKSRLFKKKKINAYREFHVDK